MRRDARPDRNPVQSGLIRVNPTGSDPVKPSQTQSNLIKVNQTKSRQGDTERSKIERNTRARRQTRQYLLHRLDSATPDTDNRWRLLSIAGPQGEVTAAQLTDAINAALAAANSSANTNAVELLDTPYDDPEKESLRQKLNELINAHRR